MLAAILLLLPAQIDSPVDFDRQIRPILSENCYRCHGPDAKERKAKLRLDVKGGLDAELRSVLVERITAEEPGRRMPPIKSGKHLTSAQVELLRRWIEQGAHWSEHWAFVPPVRAALPKVADAGWPRNGIDHFILARLEREGLKPSAEAERTRLIRRVTFDLTGLPPTPAEVDAFLADKSANAYEKVVDRLLASPHFGERLALDWLDAARYADTHGYHIDAGRDMTRWREWVIDAFNNNVPFDRFTVEQLAGDLLPKATLEQKVASGFNRNHMINFEGGAIPQEYHTAYIIDRVNTTATVFLGLTVACAQCHDHKYDPISQKEFYQLFAFFHNVPENGLDGSRGNAAPMLKAPTREQKETLARLDAEIKKLEADLAAPRPGEAAALAAWEKAVPHAAEWTVLDPHVIRSQGGATLTKQADGSILASGPNPTTDTYSISARLGSRPITGIRLEVLPDKSFSANGPGRSINGNIVLTGVQASLGKTPLRFRSASADFSQKDYPVANLVSAGPSAGWAIHPEVGKAHAAVLALEQPIPASPDRVLTVTLQFQSQFGQHQAGRFRLSVTDGASPHGKDSLPATIRKLLATTPAKRTAQQTAELVAWFRTEVAPMSRQLRQLQQEKAQVEKQMPTTMVMEEMAAPRETHMLLRGEYDKKGARVTAGIPAGLGQLPPGAPANRLGLARWLVDPSNPLTARVTVNRFWQTIFGTGLVKTAEDFGSQGERPSHPELLDWLAVEFMDPSAAPQGSGSQTRWDVKAVLRLIVTSATYRQSSAVTPGLHGRDPENRLLARGPRLRLQAEFIRDQALAVSGLLDQRIGGASVFPYQPQGLWQELASRSDGANWSAQTYVQSHGKDLYRRTMYTFWKRASPPPTLVTFDAPDREVCTVRRARTNTPLQALVLMNDPTYVEAARKLAERMITGANTPEDRIVFAFRLATARRPNERETRLLHQLFDAQMARYQRDSQAALKLLAVGESPRDQSLAPSEVAAWTVVASVILNLDEVITKQ